MRQLSHKLYRALEGIPLHILALQLAVCRHPIINVSPQESSQTQRPIRLWQPDLLLPDVGRAWHPEGALLCSYEAGETVPFRSNR